MPSLQTLAVTSFCLLILPCVHLFFYRKMTGLWCGAPLWSSHKLLAMATQSACMADTASKDQAGKYHFHIILPNVCGSGSTDKVGSHYFHTYMCIYIILFIGTKLCVWDSETKETEIFVRQFDQFFQLFECLWPYWTVQKKKKAWNRTHHQMIPNSGYAYFSWCMDTYSPSFSVRGFPKTHLRTIGSSELKVEDVTTHLSRSVWKVLL